MESKSCKQLLSTITTFILDIDGVLTDGTVHVTSSGELLRTMNVKDGYALKTAIKLGYHICIISGGKNEGVKIRLQGLGIQHIYLGVRDKVKCLETFTNAHAIATKNIVYMGDDIPDLQVIQKVGLPCCPQDAIPEIKAVCNYISHKNGGQGAVRDILEQVMKVQGKWAKNFDANYD